MRAKGVYRRMVVVLFTICSFVVCVGQSTATSKCLTYGPAVVKLTGTLVRKTFPGPPNYESIRHGDAPETAWLLNLSRPICVDKSDGDFNEGKSGISAIQLVLPEGYYKKYANLVEKRIIATGTLYGSITGHHHTPVLLTVQELVRAGKSWERGKSLIADDTDQR